jgi:hypothetical protein
MMYKLDIILNFYRKGMFILFYVENYRLFNYTEAFGNCSVLEVFRAF